MNFNALVPLDANGRPVQGVLPFVAKKTMTFDGGTTNDPGDYDGTGNPATLFNVTGDVLAVVIGICKTSLVGSGTLEVGLVGNTAVLIAQIADATNLDVNEAYVDATPALGEAFNQTPHIIGGGLDIIQTIGTANITAGVIDYYCFWLPLSEDGQVSPA